VWFKNRRAKARQQKKSQGQGSSGSSSSSTSSAAEQSASSTTENSDGRLSDETDFKVKTEESGNFKEEFKVDSSMNNDNSASRSVSANSNGICTPTTVTGTAATNDGMLDIKNLQPYLGVSTALSPSSYAASYSTFRGQTYPAYGTYQPMDMAYMAYQPVTAAAAVAVANPYVTAEQWKFPMNN
ncbi:hypothetical protein AAVH_37194, partial [Aphelenchoides avenae]